MELPDQVLGLQRIGEEASSYWTASSDDGVRLRLEPGETVHLVGQSRVKSSAENWTLPDDTEVVVTDRRIAFLTRNFDTGGGWIGFGAAGLAISVAANVVSKRRAAYRSAGLVAIGQLRHEWIESVELRREKALIGVVSTYIDLRTRTARGSVDVELWGPHVVDEKLARWLVSLLLWHRSLLKPHLSADELANLEDMKSLPLDQPLGAKEGRKWLLPGKVEHLIATVGRISSDTNARSVPPQPDHSPRAGPPEICT